MSPGQPPASNAASVAAYRTGCWRSAAATAGHPQPRAARMAAIAMSELPYPPAPRSRTRTRRSTGWAPMPGLYTRSHAPRLGTGRRVHTDYMARTSDLKAAPRRGPRCDPARRRHPHEDAAGAVRAAALRDPYTGAAVGGTTPGMVCSRGCNAGQGTPRPGALSGARPGSMTRAQQIAVLAPPLRAGREWPALRTTVVRPPGTGHAIALPTDNPSNAAPTGARIETRLCAASASCGYTSSTSCGRPTLRPRTRPASHGPRHRPRWRRRPPAAHAPARPPATGPSPRIAVAPAAGFEAARVLACHRQVWNVHGNSPVGGRGPAWLRT